MLEAGFTVLENSRRNGERREELIGADWMQYRSVETLQASAVQTRSGKLIWSRVVESGLALLSCMSEALYPGVGANGVLTAVHHFYAEHHFRPTAVFRMLRKPMFDGCQSERTREHANPFKTLFS
jgi:hypothetical protein